MNKAKCETTENKQSKSVLKRMHQVNENLVSTFDLPNNYLDKDDP